MRLRFPLWLMLSFLLLSALRSAAAVEFVRVWPGWHDASVFDSISEYFTGHEVHGRRVILRTHAGERAGFYYLVRVKNTGPALEHAKFELQVVRPTSPDTRTFTFIADVPSGETVYQLGLTGADWPGRAAHPVAWRMDLVSPTGGGLATQKSFLWEKPSQ